MHGSAMVDTMNIARDPVLKRVPADSAEAAPYGPNVATGNYVWIACTEDGAVIAVAATKRAARKAYSRVRWEWLKQRSGASALSV